MTQVIPGSEFAARLLDGRDLPTGRNDPQLSVIGAVDLRGKTIRGPRVAYGVRFLGPVDMRDLTAQGTLDLTSCVFEDSALRIDDAEITGSLELGGVAAPAVTMVGIEVGGHLGLRSAKIRDQIAVRDGRVNGFLDLRGTSADKVLLQGLRAQGDVRFGCGGEGPNEPSRINLIDAPGIEVFGCFSVEGVGVSAEQAEATTMAASAPFLRLYNAKIHGPVRVVPYQVRQNEGVDFESWYPSGSGAIIWPTLSTVDLSGAQIGGNAVFEGGRIGGYLNLNNAKISGNLRVGSAWAVRRDAKAGRLVAGSVVASYASIEGYVWAQGVKVDGDFNLNCAAVGGMIRFGGVTSLRTEVGGKLSLSGVRCPSHLEFYGVRVDGEIEMISAETGPVGFRVEVLKEDGGGAAGPPAGGAADPVVVPCQAQRLSITNTRIKGWLNLSHVQIFGFESSYGRRGLIIEDSQIDGTLSLWSIGKFREAGVPLKAWDFSAAVVGDLRIRRCQIKGDCVLTFAKVSGAIDLRDSVVGGDLKAASTASSHDATDLDAEIIEKLRALPACGDLQYRATCRELQMRMTRCDNDIDITGLSIVGEPAGPGARLGGVDARYVEVKGDLLTCLPHDAARAGGEHSEAYTDIPGCLDLSYAKIARLVVSAHSFPPPERFDADPRGADSSLEGIIFVRAQIGKLEIPEVRRERWEYPVPINLEDIAVEVWEIGGKGPEQYIALLENDPHIRRSTYRAIEENLRNSGDDDSADQVYRAMQNRDWRVKWPRLSRLTDELPRLGRLGYYLSRPFYYLLFRPLYYLLSPPIHYLFKGLLQYGTNPGRLFFAILLLALASLPVYRNPANFEASLSLLAPDHARFVRPDGTEVLRPSYGSHPPAAQWGWDDAFAKMIRYHVPVAPLIVRSDWDASDDRCVAYGGRVGCYDEAQHGRPVFNIRFLTPEDFTNLMQLLNWIFWPLLLTFWIRQLLRQ